MIRKIKEFIVIGAVFGLLYIFIIAVLAITTNQ